MTFNSNSPLFQSSYPRFYGEYELTDLARAALIAAKEIRKQRRAEEGATADGADEAEAA